MDEVPASSIEREDPPEAEEIVKLNASSKHCSCLRDSGLQRLDLDLVDFTVSLSKALQTSAVDVGPSRNTSVLA